MRQAQACAWSSNVPCQGTQVRIIFYSVLWSPALARPVDLQTSALPAESFVENSSETPCYILSEHINIIVLGEKENRQMGLKSIQYAQMVELRERKWYLKKKRQGKVRRQRFCFSQQHSWSLFDLGLPNVALIYGYQCTYLPFWCWQHKAVFTCTSM